MSHIQQQTLKQDIQCEGVGLHTGEQVRMILQPAPADTGIVFVRDDVATYNPQVRADYDNVTNTQLGTTLSNEHGTIVSTVEHLMAAFWGCGVDNAYVHLSGPEVPIMDGSSEPFVFLMECAGLQMQQQPRRLVQIAKKIEVREQDKFAIIEPAEHFSVNLSIDFDNEVIRAQSAEFNAASLCFKKDIARARTFGMQHEVDYLKSKGLARGGSLANAIVVGKDRILNKGGLRYSDEFVRHKILDCIGDIYLTGGRHLVGKFTGHRSGHDLNNKLLRTLFADPTAFRPTNALESFA